MGCVKVVLFVCVKWVESNSSQKVLVTTQTWSQSNKHSKEVDFSPWTRFGNRSWPGVKVILQRISFVGVKVEDAENRVKWKWDKGERKRRRSHRHIQTHSRNKEMSTRTTTVCAPTLNQIAIVYKMDVNSELSTAPLWIYVLTSIPNGTVVRWRLNLKDRSMRRAQTKEAFCRSTSRRRRGDSLSLLLCLM